MSRFERLYEKYANVLFRYCIHQAGRRDVAEDLASEVFLTLYQKIEEIQDEQLPSWLFAVAKNKAVDYWRHEEVAQRYERSEVGSEIESGQELPFAAMLDANKSLTPVHRQCLILRYVHELTRTEIAERTGLSELQIKGHLQYALRLLRQTFSAGKIAGAR
ncbi:MAG TPA: sigma-70 family RNA polymerase sigma factor [Candidatus Sulfotelmatobacter sp.]|nr:sigma-70 family RNA polymerase sigma factor [Candidatus Sulfotelmatobacter sp.]